VARSARPGPMALEGYVDFEPRTSSVSGNVVGCSCFRILLMTCCVWSADVHGRMPPAAVVTQLVTRTGTQASSRITVKTCLTVWPTAQEAVGSLPHHPPGSQSVCLTGPRLIRRFANFESRRLGSGSTIRYRPWHRIRGCF